MANQCKVCALGPSKVKDLEGDYIAGINRYQLTQKYGVSYDSITNHINNHLPESIVSAAGDRLQQDSLHLLEKVDELYSWMKVIFQRNYDKKKDGLALKALEAQRGTLELLAKISVALHNAKLVEIERDKQQIIQTEIPIDRLTKQEQAMYFQLLMKLTGDRTTIEVGITSRETIDEVDKDSGIEREPLGLRQNNSEKPIRRKRPEPDPTMKFQPIDVGTPPNSRTGRTNFTRTLRSARDNDESISPDRAPFLPISG